MISFKKLFSSLYLFEINYGGLTRSDKLFFILGAAAIVLSLVMKLAAATAPTPVDKKFRNQFFDLFLFAGLWEVVWFGLRYQQIRFFGSHFVALLGLLIAAIWLATLIVKMAKTYRAEKQAWEKEQVRLKYLPR